MGLILGPYVPHNAQVIGRGIHLLYLIMMKKGFPLCLLAQHGHEPLQLSQLVIFPRIPDTHSENTLRLGGAIPTEINNL